ncbi:MAG: riboflavin synthase subunit alpha [Clostridiaceae bacterium BRH_c20a]|nr:MAG: riboflavin synthase subunit alpha [Clostridiaceae bacterium BRH_c20a]
MFTGLVEELGIIKAVYNGPDSSRIKIAGGIIGEDIKLGDSVAVNGVCLTVVDFNKDDFQAQVMAETLKKTNLLELKIGDKVNLERALRMNDRLGGHLVSGHVDGVGRIVEKRRHDIAIVIRIEAPETILHYLINKGSVAIDGISLTVVDVDSKDFTVSIIPHTMSLTTLGIKNVGEIVNLEVDMLARYVESFINKKIVKDKGKDISVEFLAANGFL